MQQIAHDVVILGTGLAACAPPWKSAYGRGVRRISPSCRKCRLMRSHSVCAEGGTGRGNAPRGRRRLRAARLGYGERRDFLAGPGRGERFVRASPDQIRLLEHWGVPWSRREDGPDHAEGFWGAFVSACVHGGGQDRLLRDAGALRQPRQVQHFKRYDECFVTSLLLEGGRFAGLTLLDVPTGEFFVLRGKALLIASGGLGNLYGFTTYSQNRDGRWQAIAYRAGLPLEDPEFLPVPPTGLVPSGILMTEGCRGKADTCATTGRALHGESTRPKMMELAPRDIVSRSEMTEILEGRVPGNRRPRLCPSTI